MVAPYPMQHSDNMGQWMQPWGFGMFNPWSWCPPFQTSGMTNDPRLMGASATRADTVVTSQPSRHSASVRHSSSVPAQVTLSVPSHRPRVSSEASASVTVHSQQPSSDEEEDDDCDVNQSHLDDSDDSSAMLGNEADLFRDDAASVASSSRLRDVLDSSEDVQAEMDSKIFSKDRVDPILLSAAQLAGAEYLDDSESKSSLTFGTSGLRKKKASPILFMPPDIYEFQEEARKFKSKTGFYQCSYYGLPCSQGGLYGLDSGSSFG